MSNARFRFSIRGVLLVTGLVAMALAALANPSRFWLGTIYGVALLLLFVGILGMIYRREHARAFWTGFVIFGFGYLGLNFGPFAGLSSKLPTTLILEYVNERMLAQRLFTPAPGTYVPHPSTPIPVPPTLLPSPATNTDSLDDATNFAPSDAPPNQPGFSPLEADEHDDTTNEAAPNSVTPIYAHPTVTPIFAVPTLPYYNPTPISNYPSAFYAPYGEFANFADIGQAVCAVLLAVVGGCVAKLLYAKRRD